MKREFTKLMAALALLLFIAPLGMWGQTYTKATSIAVNDIVVMVCEADAVELTGISTTSTKYGIGTSYQGSPAGTYELTVVSGNTTGSFAFKTSNNTYLSWTSGNSLNQSATLSNNTSWGDTFDSNGNAAIVNIADDSRQIWWNHGSPRFACYTSSQTPIQLYKQSGDIPTHAYTLNVIGADEDAEALLFVNGEELDANDEIAEGETVIVSVIPSDGYTYSVAVVDADNNPVAYNSEMNSFTMPESDVTITVTTVAIPTHTASFWVNGNIASSNTYYEGAAITFPADLADIEGKTFMGWVENAIDGTTDEAPTFVTSATMGNADVTYYAVFATATEGEPEDTKIQTLQYDTWTFGGSTTDKTSYRLFHNGGYVESAAFDLSKLSKVIVYGGTYGGDSFNSLTIGDGTNVWKNVTVSGSSQTGINTYTEGTALTGNGKLRVTSNSGSDSGNGSGVRISKVEIFVMQPAMDYSEYCTTVALPNVQRPVITVAENPFLFSTTVTITCATEGASIQYSFDNETWNAYSVELTINETKTIYAKASNGTEESSVASVTATKNLAEPTIAIDHSGITNTNVFMGTEAGSLAASVTYNDSPVEGATVTWSGDDDNVATINANGAVTLVAEGSVTFTASFAGNSDYSAKTATYEMAVTNVNPNMGTITFGTNHVKIDAANVTGNDNLGNTWSIVTEGTNSYTSNAAYYQVGSSSDPATSITFTTTLPENRFVTGFSAKFGGFNGSAGVVTLKIGETTVGTGSLNGSSDVTVTNNNNTASGNVLTVTVTNIAKGVKCYYISYTLAPVYTLSGITGYTGEKDHYYLIASPVTVDPSTVAGMTEGDFDLYRFNQAAALEWENWKNEGSDNYHFNLVPGTGYLYAKKATTENPTYSFKLTGIPYAGNGTIDLDYDADAEFPGFNLIGNPFGTKANLDLPYYRLNSDGSALNTSTESDPVFVMEGVFVEATSTIRTATFSPAAKRVSQLNVKVTRNRSAVLDNAIIRFDNGAVLGKFQLNPNSTKLYITEGNQDFAVVRSDSEAEMPVSFKAAENGNYTLSVEAENVEMNYLHLIDNKTGNDVDLLATPSYSFEANTRDYANRFKLVFKANAGVEENAATETFAYFNGSEWVINNPSTGSGDNATLQVIDMMGRVLSSETISGNANVTLNQAAGIYMLRLVNGENVKVQKVVVR